MSRRWMVVAAGWFSLACGAPGQSFDLKLPETMRDGPPAEEVIDHAGVFHAESGVKDRLAGEIRRLEREHGFRIRLWVEKSWLGENVRSVSGFLQEAWFPNGDGLVILFESDNGNLGFGFNASGKPMDFGWKMPTHESTEILRRAMHGVDPNAPVEAYLEELMLGIVSEHRAYFEKRKQGPPRARNVRMALFTLGAFALLGLGALVASVVARHARQRASRSVLRFPSVSRPERFGAPLGGGMVVTRRFRDD